MFYRKDTEIVKEDTLIWACNNDDCVVWMRDDFAFETVPTCPSCGSSMKKDIKMLPVLK